MASSSKVQTEKGAKVTTIVTSNNAIGAEPSLLKLEVVQNGKAGFTWGDGGSIVKLVKGGLAEKSGVTLDHRLHSVNSTVVKAELKKTDIEKLLVVARKKKYTLTFRYLEEDGKAVKGHTVPTTLQLNDASAATREHEKQNNDHTNEKIDQSVERRSDNEHDEKVCSEMTMAVDLRNDGEKAVTLEENDLTIQSIIKGESKELTVPKEKTQEEIDIEEAEAAQKLEEVRLAAIAAEEARKLEEERLFKLRNGKVMILYNMYKDEFDLVDGKIQSSVIDEEYCLSDCMPGCHIHLSRISPEEYTKLSQPSEFGSDFVVKYEHEEPWGTFQQLETRRKYYVWVVQDPKEEEKDRAKMKDQWKTLDAAAQLAADSVRTYETCSCIEGNPCVDPYNCLDWYNRIAVAKQHGYKAGAETRLL